ncbi:MAG: Clp protease ClpP [Bacteroidales bacterium]|nr:Clp protease ClpP [Bacteroidales bacterium]
MINKTVVLLINKSLIYVRKEMYFCTVKLTQKMKQKKRKKTNFFNEMMEDSVATIYLYSFIGDYEGDVSAMNFAKELSEKEKKYKNIEIRINSKGGEILEGIAIFNAIMASSANINIFVDGVAASMASVIALCGKPLKMSKYARLMIHCAYGGSWGDKNKLKSCIEQMESLEDTLAEMMSKKMNKTKEEILDLFFDGTDHWLTAQEALDYGIIDGIYDVEPIPEGSTPEDIFDIFSNRLLINKKQERMYDNLRKMDAFKNCATDVDIENRVITMAQEAQRTATLEARVAELEQKEQAAMQAEINSLVDAAVEDHRITEAQKPHFVAILTANRENGEAVLASMTPKKSVETEPNDPAYKEGDAWSKRQQEIENQNKK